MSEPKAPLDAVKHSEWNSNPMTVGQYQALVAYLSFWRPLWVECSLEIAMRDIGIIANPKVVINSLSESGWDYDEETRTIRFTANDEDGSYA